MAPSPTPSPAPTLPVDLPRKVGLWGGLAVLIGVVIGSGIFQTPADIARASGSPALILALWALGGLVALAGALTFAELAAMLPRSGGLYVFLRAGFGDCPAFVFGWTYMLLTKPAAAGGIAIIFSEHLKSLTGWELNAPLLTCLTLTILTIINWLGVTGSTRLAIALSAIKYTAIAAIILLGIAAALGLRPGSAPPPPGFLSTPPPMGLLAAVAAIMMGVMWTYDGWADVGSIAGEVTDPGRNLPRVLFLGTLAVVVLYVLINAVYLYHVPLTAMRDTTTVAPLLTERLIGPAGAAAVTVLIILSTLGSSHVSVMTGARVTFAQARDGLLFSVLGCIDPRTQTPAVALFTQLALSCLAVSLLQDFASLASTFVFTIWIFYGLGAAAVLVLRRTSPDAPRPFRVPLYPFLPILFILASIGMTTLQLIADPAKSALWLAVLAAGVPAFFLWRRLHPPARQA